MAEESLLGLFESGVGGRFGRRVQGFAVAHDAGGAERFVDVAVNDPEGAGVAVPDIALGRRQAVFEDVDFDAAVRQRARLVEAEGFEIPRDDFHRGDPAPLHGGDEVGAVRESGGAAAPESEARRVGEPAYGAGSGRGRVENAGVRQGVPQPQAREPLLRGLRVAAFPGRAGGVGHGVGLVEDDHAVELVSGGFAAAGEPADDLGRVVTGRPRGRARAGWRRR